MFTPKNEQGVLYLFSRHHEDLGFEEILQVQTGFPDVIALRDGKEVKIELEFQLGSFKTHYIFKPFPRQGWWKWDERYQAWRVVNPGTGDFIEVTELELRMDNSTRKKFGLDSAEVIISDPERKYEKTDMGKLVYKSLKDQCDCIICWEKGNVTLEEDIEIIELKKELTE